MSTDQPSAGRQEVKAEGGFAYRITGADIHVFGDGTPVYLLFAHRSAAAVADPGWRRAQPSRMLDARAEVVEFTGRDADLRELIAWRKAEPRFSVRWLHDEEGQGKTRLAAQFAADSERAGWKVIDVAHRTDAHPPAPPRSCGISSWSCRLRCPGEGQRWIQNIIARDHSTAYAALGGNVIHYDLPGRPEPQAAARRTS